MKTIFGFLALTITCFSFAGEKGNGGYSIVCRNEANLITTAEVLDIYEGRILYRRNYSVDLNSVEDLVAIAKEKAGFHGIFHSKLEKELALVEKNMIFIPEGNELEATDDAFPVIKKKGCKFEQLANYTDEGELYVSQEIYDHLDNVNKAALFLHEAIYSIRRKSVGETTSQNTRRLVAHLLAGNGDTQVIERWVYDSVQRPNNKRPCGLKGTIQERIESCSYLQPEIFGMTLVTRTENLKEVWFDYYKKIYWSDRLAEKMNFDRAKTACAKETEEMGFLGLNWKLPSAEDYQYGETLVNVLPNMTRFSESYWFWTSTIKGRMVKTFNSTDGSVGFNPFTGSNSGSVRCVAAAN